MFMKVAPIYYEASVPSTRRKLGLGVNRFSQQAQKPGIFRWHGQISQSLIAIQVVEYGKDLFLGSGLA
jgi:hypothetical protein